MSLREAYTLAHTAQCRLNIEASRPDRNLRYVVGHLQHYESLRLRIVEIEHDLSTRNPSTSLHFHRLQHKPSTGQLGKAPPPPAADQLDEEDEEDEYDDALFDDEEDDGLSLSRFPSGSSRAQPPPPEHHDPEPDLSHSPSASSDEYDEDEDEEDDYDDDFLISYPEPSEKTIEATIQKPSDPSLTKLYEKVKGCPCHNKTEDVPSFERMWELPGQKKGRRRKGSVTVLGQEKSNATTTVQVQEVAA